MTDNTDFNFDLEPLTKNVTLGGKAYTLREASEDTAVKFKNLGAKAVRFKSGEASGLDGVGNVQPFLVGLCLFDASTDKPVGEAFARSLPARVCGPLFDWVSAASGLGGEKDTVEAIDKKIEALQKKRADLVAGGASDPKGTRSDTCSTSS